MAFIKITLVLLRRLLQLKNFTFTTAQKIQVMVHWLLLISLLCLTSCAQEDLKENGSFNLVKAHPDKPFYTYDKSSFYLVKDSVKVNPLEYDLTLKGKGQFIRFDSQIKVTALEQALTLTIREKADPGNGWRITLKPRQNPHFTKTWKNFERGDTPGFTDRDAHFAFRTYMTYRFLDQPVPKFQKATVSGQPITHESFTGHVTMINFWYYGCRACHLEIPALNLLRSEYQNDERVQLLAFFRDSITVGNNNQRLYKSHVHGPGIKEMAPISALPSLEHANPDQFNWPQIPNCEDINEQFNIMGFPTTMIIDQNGIIRYIKVGVVGLEPDPEIIFQKLKRKIEHFRS